MGLWQKFVNWVTGRSEKESEVYANYDKVEQVRSEIRSIAMTKVGNAQDEFNDAIMRLNNVNGLAQYVGTVQATNYNTVFESITSTIENIGDALTDKAEAIKKYEESEWYEKLGSSISMGLCKIGEGLLSVVEDLGDAVVSVVGWGAEKLGATGFSEDCAKFVKSEWSHDAFNFYYKSDFAKASTFTEDSGLAGGFKILGKVAGYIALGKIGVGTLHLSTAAEGAAGGASYLFGASGTTMVQTTLAGLTGFGSGAEASLNQGNGFDEAMVSGAWQGVKSAALAYAAGRYSDHLVHKEVRLEASKLAQNAAEDSDAFTRETIGETSKQGEDVVNEIVSGQKVDTTITGGLKNTVKEYAGKFSDMGGKAINKFDDLIAKAPGGNIAVNVISNPNSVSVLNGIQSEIRDEINVSKMPTRELRPVRNMVASEGTNTESTKYIEGSSSAGTGGYNNVVVEKTNPNYSPLPSITRTTSNVTTANRPSYDSVPRTTTSVGASVAQAAPKVVAQVPTVSVGAAVGNGATAASSAAKGAASLANLSGNWTDTGYTPKEMPTPGKVQPNTIKPGNGSITPVPGSDGKTKSNVPITYHSGGEYNENGYVGDKNTSIAASIAGLTDDTDKIIGNIMNGDLRDNATKIPTGNKPINIGKKVGGGATIPLAAGLTTAAAAGLGAKAYSDYKRAQEEAEEEEYEDEYEEFDKDGIIEDGWTNEEIMKEMIEEDQNEKDFINIDKQDEDEYYRISENPLPIENEEGNFA